MDRRCKKDDNEGVCIMAKTQIIDVDISEKLSNYLLDLINQCPALYDAEIKFSELGESSGIGFFPSAGSALLENMKGIIGDRYQLCAYQFDIIYRASPKTDAQKIRIKEFLDGLGRWLERQPVNVSGVTFKLDSYPEIESGYRFVREIVRNNTAHLQSAYSDGVEDWSISLIMRYTNYY